MTTVKEALDALVDSGAAESMIHPENGEVYRLMFDPYYAFSAKSVQELVDQRRERLKAKVLKQPLVTIKQMTPEELAESLVPHAFVNVHGGERCDRCFDLRSEHPNAITETPLCPSPK